MKAPSKLNPHPIHVFITGGKYGGLLGEAHFTDKKKINYQVLVEGNGWQTIKKDFLKV